MRIADLFSGTPMESPDMIFHRCGSLSDLALDAILHKHYLKRKPPMCDVFEWWTNNNVVGVLTTGYPASRHMQSGALPSDPDSVVELNRLWLDDNLPHGRASWFVSRCMKMMPPLVVISYADTAAGHFGHVYRACNFYYAGWTDMDRKTPRFDYDTKSKHSRDASRQVSLDKTHKIRRQPKVKYWTATGNKRERRALVRLCTLPRLDWKTTPPPVNGALS